MRNEIYTWPAGPIYQMDFSTTILAAAIILLPVLAIGAFCTLLSLPDEYSRKGVIPALIATTLIAPVATGVLLFVACTQDPVSDAELEARDSRRWAQTDPTVLTRNVNVWAASYDINLDATCALPGQENIPVCATGAEIVPTDYFTAVHLDGTQGRYRIDVFSNPILFRDISAVICPLDSH